MDLRSTTSTPCPAGLGWAFFAMIFFGRAWVIREWGSPLPYYDQWSAEGLALYRPWLTGQFDWTVLVAGHNEHRIVFTRATDLILLNLCGEWRTWWQLLINAALNAVTALILVRTLWNGLSERLRVGFVFGCVILFTALSGWENALWGFQSQFYFNHLFTVLGFGMLAFSRPFSRGWYAAHFCGLAALFTNAAGTIAAGALLALSVTQTCADSNGRAGRFLACLPALGLMMLGLALLPDVAAHQRLHAASVQSFVRMLIHCLSWPWIDSDFAWVVLYAPLVALLVVRWYERRWPAPAEQLILALGLFVVLIAAATAWSRSGELKHPISRYQDTLMLGALANFAACLSLVHCGRIGRLATIGWAGIVIAGLIHLSTTYLTIHLRLKKFQDDNGLAEAQTFYQTLNPETFSKDPFTTSLSPDFESVKQALSDPVLRKILPPEITSGEEHCPRLITYSPFFAGLSGLVLTTLLWRQRSRRSGSPDERAVRQTQRAS